jgi:hypothetical protein
MAAPRPARPRAPERELGTFLKTLRQGDLISLGAVTIVGKGPTALLDDAGASGAATNDDLWSLTAESAVGWYVICSQDCDLVRDVEVEPCVLVCPLSYVDASRWEQLRHGPYSPREFPYPADAIDGAPAGRRPVADVRVITSVDKLALIDPAVETRRPLTGRQAQRFSEWLARRFARAAHDDKVDRDVLAPAAAVLRALTSRAAVTRDRGQVPAASGRVALAAEEWLVGGSEKRVVIAAITSAASLIDAGFGAEDGAWDEDAVEAGRVWIERKIAGKLPAGGGYVCQLEVWTLDAMPAAIYRDYNAWMFDDPGDALAP